jgi:asparagine synthase (glutamine-hydrolysing)
MKTSNRHLQHLLPDSLGFTGWFEDIEDSAHFFDLRFANLIKKSSVHGSLDGTALCEFATRYAFFGSRTLLSRIRRSDLFAVLSSKQGSERSKVPPHGNREASSLKIAEGLAERLMSETACRVGAAGRVGLLLSGGMDSRIAAACLRALQNRGYSFNVTCFCWGQPETRDPVYARLIAEKYAWNFEHFDVTAETLLNNVDHTAGNGCFHSAQHLHAMPQVAARAQELGMEIMLAASYGDSIGRAEYGGVHVSNLKPVEGRLHNWYDLIEPELFERSRKETLAEIVRCRETYGEQSALATNELDHQLHYMRNMLGSAMSVIDASVPLAQVFTSREVVEYMWGFSPSCRNDEVYLHLLQGLDAELLEIPWARTGKPYLQDHSHPDPLPASFHRYADWTREIADDLEARIFSGELERLNAFNMKAVRRVFDGLMNHQFIQTGRFLEVTLWLASLATLVAELKPPPVREGPPPRRMTLRGRLQYHATLANQYRHFGRKRQN